MEPIFASRASSLFDLISKISEGDPVAIGIVVAIVTFTVLLTWLFTWWQKVRGERLANAIGDCEYKFSPNGLFGNQIYRITGQKHNLPFSLEAFRIRKGDYRTYLHLHMPPEASWKEITHQLDASKALVSAATRADESPGKVTLEYAGVGGDAALIQTLLKEVAGAVEKRSSQSLA